MKILSQYSKEAGDLLKAFGLNPSQTKSFKFHMAAGGEEFPTISIEYYPDTESIDTATIKSIVKNYHLVEKE